MRRNLFSMVEVLVVIAIITIIAGISLPVMMQVRARADRTNTQAKITGLITAIQQYRTHFQVLPFTYPSTTGADYPLTDADYDTLLLVLAGDNPRDLSLLELGSGGTYTDSWDGRFHIVLDTNYDNKIAHELLPGVSANLKNSIAIWSRGKSNVHALTEGPTHDSNKDNIVSW